MLGVRELSDKSSKQTLATFKEILNDIDTVLGKSDNTVEHKILRNIRCTMSDQASTCKSFNELLTDYRSSMYHQYKKIGHSLPKVKSPRALACTFFLWSTYTS